MKKFILKTLLFICFLLIINLIFKKILDDIYFNEYYNVNLDNDTYLLSDSHGHALGNFNDDHFYNFSMGSDSYLDMKNKLNYLIRKSNIKTIILTADDHTLSTYRDNSNNLDRSSYFNSRIDYPNFFEFFKKKFLYQNLVLFEPKYGTLLNQYFKSLFSPPFSSKEVTTWFSLSEKVKEQRSLERYIDQFAYSRSSNNLEGALLDIIKTCRDNGIKIIGVKFPLSKQYNKILGEKSFHADSLLIRNNIKVYNFNNKIFQSEDLFSDQDHLNNNGAKIFKQILLDSLR